MADAEERRQQASIQPPEALVPDDRREAVPHAAVRPRRVAAGRQHARLDDPDRVRQHGGHGAGQARGLEVVDRAEVVSGGQATLGGSASLEQVIARAAVRPAPDTHTDHNTKLRFVRRLHSRTEAKKKKICRGSQRCDDKLTM